MIRARATLALALTAATLTACGSGKTATEPPKTDDPVAVATAYYQAWFGCGDQGQGRQWDLRASSFTTREQAIKNDQELGCRPSKAPEVEGSVSAQQGEEVAVTLRAPADASIEQQMVLVKQKGQWKVSSDGGKPEEARE